MAVPHSAGVLNHSELGTAQPQLVFQSFPVSTNVCKYFFDILCISIYCCLIFCKRYFQWLTFETSFQVLGEIFAEILQNKLGRADYTKEYEIYWTLFQTDYKTCKQFKSFGTHLFRVFEISMFSHNGTQSWLKIILVISQMKYCPIYFRPNKLGLSSFITLMFKINCEKYSLKV